MQLHRIFTDASIRLRATGLGVFTGGAGTACDLVAGRVLDPAIRDVNYCEMLAILLALRLAPPRPLVIGTDSMVSMKLTANPCLAKPAFKAIACTLHETIRAHPFPIRLHKVPAHAGVAGNVLADRAARRATMLAEFERVCYLDDSRHVVPVGLASIRPERFASA